MSVRQIPIHTYHIIHVYYIHNTTPNLYTRIVVMCRENYISFTSVVHDDALRCVCAMMMMMMIILYVSRGRPPSII